MRDAGDPSTLALLGDTPGPLGVNDCGDPMRLHRRPHTPTFGLALALDDDLTDRPLDLSPIGAGAIAQAEGNDQQLRGSVSGWPRTLKWEDYTGLVPPHQQREAMTAASLAGQFQLERVGRLFRATVRVVVEFVANESWVRPQSRADAALLTHEQGHFDITGLMAFEMARSLEAVQGRKSKDVESRAKKVMSRVMDKWTAIFGDGGQYDQETNHGADAARQAAWTASIKAHIDADRRALDDPPVHRPPKRHR
jgi:hypothetical protein